jgi:acetyl esterase/lipase
MLHKPLRGARDLLLMTSTWILLTLAVFGALATVAAVVPGRFLGWGNMLWFALSMPVAELPLFHVALSWLTLLVLEQFGALGALPGQIGAGLIVASSLALLLVQRRALSSEAILEAALHDALGRDFAAAIPPERRELLQRSGGVRPLLLPFALRRGPVLRERDIPYGSHPQQMLDVYRPAQAMATRAPVLIQLHGGGWITGSKDDQALPLIYHLAARGWLVVAANYRLSPAARFPDALVDCKRVVAWVRDHAVQLGADPQYIAITGGSAGAHLASLVALTPGRPDLQPGFEQAATHVSACVPLYGVYDFIDRGATQRDGGALTRWLERTVMPCAPAADPALWDLASPVAQCSAGAPPFFVLHGTADSLAKVEEARLFVAELRTRSAGKVAYGELPGAQHAWDFFHSVRCRASVRAIASFLEWQSARARS